MFNKENKGFLELYFSSDDICSLLEVLAFTDKMCKSIILSKEEMSDEMLHMVSEKQLLAATLEEKILADVEPGRPEGFLN
jgi:hypothetical protein